MKPPWEKDSIEVIRRKLERLDEHRQECQRRRFPQAWKTFLSTLPQRPKQNLLETPTAPRRLIREDGWISQKVQEYDKRKGEQEQQIEAWYVAELRKSLARLVGCLNEELRAAPIAIVTDLNYFLNDEDLANDNKVKSALEKLEAVIASHSCHFDDRTDVFRAEKEMLLRAILAPLEVLDERLLQKLSSRTGKSTAHRTPSKDIAARKKRVIELRQQHPRLSREELANLAKNDPMITGLGLEREITVGTIHDDLKKPKKRTS